MVWVVHGERPASRVLVGGALLVSSLITHEVLALLEAGIRLPRIGSKPAVVGIDGTEDESSQPLKGWQASEEVVHE